MSPISDAHDLLRLFLIHLLGLFVQHGQWGVLHSEPFQMKTAPHLPGRSPDILFVANAHQSRIQKAHPEGRRDSVDKFAEYEEGGVLEYWLLDQPRRQATFYGLGDDGRYHPLPIDEDGIFHSLVLPGFWLKVEWLWQQPHPAVLDILREWGVI